MTNLQALAIARFMNAQCGVTVLRRDVDPEVKRQMMTAMTDFAQASRLERKNMEWVIPQNTHWSELRAQEGAKAKP